MLKVYNSYFFVRNKVRGDWSGPGELVCYSHYESDADFPEGASNEAPAKVTCRPVEWKYPEVDLGPEAMFFHPDSGEDFEIWAVRDLNIHKLGALYKMF